VTREEINEEYVKRASSGVVLVLSQVPFFEHLCGPSRLVVREKPGETRTDWPPTRLV
jgi:hypothetical protein